MDILLKYDVLKTAVKHAVVVLNTAAQGEELNKALPSYFKYGVANKSLQLFTVDATHASESAGNFVFTIYNILITDCSLLLLFIFLALIIIFMQKVLDLMV